MNKLVAVVVALALWCGSAAATTAWTPSSMGAGGNFTSADINSDGVVLIGSDVSGFYRRSGNSGDWTRIGSNDGLTTTHIYSFRFNEEENNKILAGTGRGIFWSQNTGDSWSRVSSANGPTVNIGAVCWASDYNSGNGDGRAYVTYNTDAGTSPDEVNIALSTNYGHTFPNPRYTIVSESYSAGNDPERQPIKVATDPSTNGSTRAIYVLMGITTSNSMDGAAEAAYDSMVGMVLFKHYPPRHRELYQSLDNGATWRCLISSNVIDFAIDSTAAHHLAVAYSSSNYCDANRYGTVWTTTDAGQPTVTWTQQTVENTYGDETGALWYKNGDLYLLTVSQDPCSGSHAPGVWVKSGGSWTHVDDGQGGGTWSPDTWESGWTVAGSSPCPKRYGQTIANTAQSVSPRGEYRVTASFVWQYDWGVATGRGYKSSFTNSGSGPYTGKKIDNVNVAALYLDGTDLWAGYYDVGLWKLSGSGWENHNATGFGSWDGNGGNINGITKYGSTMYVCAASSSKGADWRIWSNSTAGFPAANWSQLVDLNAYCRGLTLGSASTYRFWITVAGAVKYSSDATTWTASATGTNNLSANATYTTINGANAGWVVAGGREGIWTNSNYGANGYWTKTLDFGSDLGGSLDQKEQWVGVHDIFYEATTGYYYAAVYDKSSGSSGKGGIWRSTDNAMSWSKIIDRQQCRGVVADSCGSRIIYTTAEEFSSGPNSTTGQFASDGVTVARSGGAIIREFDVFADVAYRNPFGARIAFYPSTSSGKLYVGAPGYGPMIHDLLQPETCSGGGGCDDPPCEQERAPSSARRPLEEAQSAPVEHRRAFTISEARALVLAGRLELYDVTGRRARDVTQPGLFFSIERNKAGVVTARHLVLVQR